MTRTPDELASALLEAMEKAGDERRQSREGHWCRREAELRTTLAALFGASRGWRRARTPFSLRALQGRKMHSNTNYGNDGVPGVLPRPWFDHPYWYRADRRAVAIAAHLYGGDTGDIQSWADAKGLRATWPDFPSWWYPGSTTFVLYEPAGSPPGDREGRV